MKRKLCAVMVVLLLAACASTTEELRINGSSALTTERGIAAMKRQLKKEDRLPFTAAIVTIQFSEIYSSLDMTDLDMIDKEKLTTIDMSVVGKKIHGMTYQEILALAAASPNKVTIERHSRVRN